MHDSGVASDSGHISQIFIEEGEHVLAAQQQVDLARGVLALLNERFSYLTIRLSKAINIVASTLRAYYMWGVIF